MTSNSLNPIQPWPGFTEQQMAVWLLLTRKLHELGAEGEFLKTVSVGPVVSVYQLRPKNASRVGQICGMSEDFSVALGSPNIVIQRLPGESTIGFFVPNEERILVDFLNTTNAVHLAAQTQEIPLNLGVDHLGKSVVVDLVQLPHLLLAGSTGSGKSTELSAILASLIYSKSKSKLKLVLSDTKNVEFMHFEGAPHLLYPIAKDVDTTLQQLNYIKEEMSKRLNSIGKRGFRNITEYNEAATTSFLPRIVIVIDELADLLLDTSKRLVDDKAVSVSKLFQQTLQSITQKSRAAGIHVIAGVQRPSVDVVKGNIKVNFPARLCFRVPSGTDSRVVLNQNGAEQLLSRGDMLFLNPNQAGLQRLHAPFAKLSDLEAAVEAAVREQD